MEELALEGGESELPVPGGGVTVLFGGATLFADLRLEPTRFFKRAFMEDMNERAEKERAGRRRGERRLSVFFGGGGEKCCELGLLELRAGSAFQLVRLKRFTRCVRLMPKSSSQSGQHLIIQSFARIYQSPDALQGQPSCLVFKLSSTCSLHDTSSEAWLQVS